ncbi:MAG: J domain-containing protein [Myxococcota bacterium]
MSFTRKIIDGARDGINTVMDKVAADDTPLSHVDEVSLQRELKLRIASGKANPRKPRDNSRARLAGASSEARQRRAKMAEDRADRVHRIRDKRARAAEAEQEAAFERAKEQARRSASSGSSSRRSTGGGSTGGSRWRGGGFPFQRPNDKIAEYYKVLDLPVGAPFDEVKASYRKLMRKYHPDRHVGNAKKQKAATELSMRVTQAYNELEQYLKKK